MAGSVAEVGEESDILMPEDVGVKVQAFIHAVLVVNGHVHGKCSSERLRPS